MAPAACLRRAVPLPESGRWCLHIDYSYKKNSTKYPVGSSFIEYIKAKVDEIMADWARCKGCTGGTGVTNFTRSVLGMHIHDGVVVIEKTRARLPAR